MFPNEALDQRQHLVVPLGVTTLHIHVCTEMAKRTVCSRPVTGVGLARVLVEEKEKVCHLQCMDLPQA